MSQFGCYSEALGYMSQERSYLRHWRYYMTFLRQVPHGLLRRTLRKRCRGYADIDVSVRGRCGIEIGGPSRIFRKNGLVPVYDRCRKIDACNFSEQTIWTKDENKGLYASTLGTEHIVEACNLSMIPDGSYDFLLASHVLEHIANPLLALREWKRVLKMDGTAVVIVPDKRATFDHKRPYTSLDHIKMDFERATKDDDLSHLDEILALHDLALDPGCSVQQFRERCLQNARFRGMHHHVFKPEVLLAMFSEVGMQVTNLTIERPYHIIVFARAADPASVGRVPSVNSAVVNEDAQRKKLERLRTAG